jgi:pimeloyl-ACP methyl ester carboxylesterase
MISRRHVLHLSGYDPLEPKRLHRRFKRELATFARTWKLDASTSEQHTTWTGTTWGVTTAGPNWRVETSYETLDWDDIVRADLSGSMIKRLRDAVPAFADFIFTGTAFRYVAASNRYALFFLTPLLEFLLFVTAAVLFGMTVAAVLPLGIVTRAIVAGVLAVVAFFVLARWPGRYLRFDQALSDWIFARAYMRGRRPDIEVRIKAFATRLVTVMRAREVDEVLLVGHSLGSLIAIDLLCQALELDPDVFVNGPRLAFLTIGATVPKLTLHPAGDRFRACVNRIAANPAVDWVEYQARDDAISFYKFNPVTSRRIDEDDPGGKPLIRRVQMHDMLTPESYHRYRWRFMRLHYQFVMANERRAAYDYFMLACGPVPVLATAQAGDGPNQLYGPAGELVAQMEMAG